jgi:hypothetical protein
MNARLKEIAEKCRIRKPLTFHVARHTFSTTVTLQNGVPIESVSKMLGHTHISTTQHYAKILDVKVGEDMGLIKMKLQYDEGLVIHVFRSIDLMAGFLWIPFIFTTIRDNKRPIARVYLLMQSEIKEATGDADELKAAPRFDDAKPSGGYPVSKYD